MSDATPFPHDLLGTADDDELIFDEAPPVDISVPVVPQTETEPRRVPRRGRASAGEKAPPPEPVAAPSMPSPSAEALAAAVEEPAGAPAPFPPLGADPAGSKSHPLLLAVVGFALLTSTVSLGGMIAVSRTLALAGADRGAAAAERAALAGVPKLVADIDAANARLNTAEATRVGPAAAASVGGAAITANDLHREIDGLKLAIDQHQPQGLGALDGTTREGFSELATRLDRLSAEIDQWGKRAGAVSASRPASRAGDPRQPS